MIANHLIFEHQVAWRYFLNRPTNIFIHLFKISSSFLKYPTHYNTIFTPPKQVEQMFFYLDLLGHGEISSQTTFRRFFYIGRIYITIIRNFYYMESLYYKLSEVLLYWKSISQIFRSFIIWKVYITNFQKFYYMESLYYNFQEVLSYGISIYHFFS